MEKWSSQPFGPCARARMRERAWLCARAQAWGSFSLFGAPSLFGVFFALVCVFARATYFSSSNSSCQTMRASLGMQRQLPHRTCLGVRAVLMRARAASVHARAAFACMGARLAQARSPTRTRWAASFTYALVSRSPCRSALAHAPAYAANKPRCGVRRAGGPLRGARPPSGYRNCIGTVAEL